MKDKVKQICFKTGENYLKINAEHSGITLFCIEPPVYYFLTDYECAQLRDFLTETVDSEVAMRRRKADSPYSDTINKLLNEIGEVSKKLTNISTTTDNHPLLLPLGVPIKESQIMWIADLFISNKAAITFLEKSLIFLRHLELQQELKAKTL